MLNNQVRTLAKVLTVTDEEAVDDVVVLVVDAVVVVLAVGGS